jgi:hypothetical protein
MNGISRSIGVVLLLAPCVAHAGVENAGTTAATFLSVGSGAGVIGMGGATLGLANGLATTAWNPGGLGFLERGEVTLSHASLSDQTNQEWAAMGGRLGLGEARWSLSGLFQSEGSFEGRDGSNNSTGSFQVSSLSVGGALAYSFGGTGALGVGAKYVRENLGPSSNGSGVTFDAGLLLRAGMFGFGVAGHNVGGTMTFGASSYPFPSNYGAGVSVTHAHTGLKADIDVNVPSDYYANVRAGVEWSWQNRLAVRGGYRHELGASSDDALNGPSFGAGAGAYGMWLDYGFLVTSSGEGQHRLGVSLHPGGMNWSAGDPFGQKNMPRDFDSEKEKKDQSGKSSKTEKKS